MARIFIVEDEEIILEKLLILLEELEHEVVGHSGNADEAFDKIKVSDADLVLLDIALPGKNNGITIGKQLNENLDIPFIFTSSFQDKETIGEAADCNPVTYLTKPIQKGDLLAAIELALRQKKTEKTEEQDTKDVFYTKIGDKLSKIEVSDILFINAADSNYCDLTLKDGRKVSLRTSLLKLMQQLPSGFIQTHRQYAVRLDAVEHINMKEQAIIIGEEAIPLGRSYKDEFMKRIERM
ncbi:MAG: response regulator transcription factor [Bacteroidales bacterium]|nr:response regulator transcription factor [Bacteroidales bacterium]